MKKMQIFEPAMCCSTGLCGVGVDSELLRISTILNNLNSKEIVVDRFNLNSAPQEFVANEKVSTYLKEKGVDGLPIVLVDEAIVVSGRYPTNDEFVKFLDIPKDLINGEEPSVESAESKSEGCCCSDGGCCC